MKEKPTYEVIDLVYTKEEGNIVMQGSLEECNKFVASQSDAFTYQVVPIVEPIHWKNDDENKTN